MVADDSMDKLATRLREHFKIDAPGDGSPPWTDWAEQEYDCPTTCKRDFSRHAAFDGVHQTVLDVL